MFHRYYDTTLLGYCWAEQLEEVRQWRQLQAVKIAATRRGCTEYEQGLQACTQRPWVARDAEQMAAVGLRMDAQEFLLKHGVEGVVVLNFLDHQLWGRP